MENAAGEEPVGRSHQVATAQPQRKDHQYDEYERTGRVGYAGVRARKDNCLKNIRDAWAEEHAVFLKEQTARDKFLFKAICERNHQECGSEREQVDTTMHRSEG